MIYRIVSLLCLCIPLLAKAVPVSNLYSAQVLMGANQEEADLLQNAFSKAATQVLARVSGKEVEIKGELAPKIVQQASKWVAEHAVQALPGLYDIDGVSQPAKQVKVDFYPQLVNQFLYAQGLPVWGSNRPSILVWVISEQNGFREVAGANRPTSALNTLASHAQILGLPIYAPLYDGTDQNNLSGSELWGMFEDSIISASKRYQTDMVLAVKVAQLTRDATASAELFITDMEPVVWQLTAENETAVLESLIGAVAAELSERYASTRSDITGDVVMRVTNINDASALRQVSSYLSSIDVVRNVRLATLDGQTVEWVLTLDGDQQKLFNSIRLRSILVAQTVSALDPDANRVLAYKYNRGN